MSDEPRKPRFLAIEQAAEELNVKLSLIRALIKTGELRGIQIGGRGYLAHLLRLMGLFPEIGEERRMQRLISASFVRFIEPLRVLSRA